MSAPIPVSPIFGLGNGRGGGAGGIVYPPDVEQHLENVGRTLSIPLPEVFPIPDARVFNAECQQASAIAQTFVLGFTPAVEIPAGYYGIVTSFTIYVQNMLATTNVTFSLLSNGNPVQGFAPLTIFPGASPRAANTFDTPQRFTGDVTLTVSITNGEGGSYLLGAALSGWFWPIASDRRWKSAGPIDAG